jgi:hypothetical protein
LLILFNQGSSATSKEVLGGHIAYCHDVRQVSVKVLSLTTFLVVGMKGMNKELAITSWQLRLILILGISISATFEIPSNLLLHKLELAFGSPAS